MWKGQWTKKLREMPYCKVIVFRETVHDEIHNQIQTVPVPKEINAKIAIDALNRLKDFGSICIADSFEKRLKILISLFECIEDPTADALRLQLEIVSSFKSL